MTTSGRPDSTTGTQVNTATDPERLPIHDVDPKAYLPLYALERYTHAGSLGEALLALVKLRASQLNGCARCLVIHVREAREADVDQRKLDVLAGWHEATGLFTEREVAALRLTEEVTLINEAGVTDAVWDSASKFFSPQQMVELLMAIAAINVWNRLAVATHRHLPEPTGPTP